MNDFIEAMIKGHDNTEYRWVSGKCRGLEYVIDLIIFLFRIYVYRNPC